MYDALCLQLGQEASLYVFFCLLPQSVQPQTPQVEMVEDALHVDFFSSEEGAFPPPKPRRIALVVVASVESNCITARFAASLEVLGAALTNNFVNATAKFVFDASTSFLERDLMTRG